MICLNVSIVKMNFLIFVKFLPDLAPLSVIYTYDLEYIFLKVFWITLLCKEEKLLVYKRVVSVLNLHELDMSFL